MHSLLRYSWLELYLSPKVIAVFFLGISSGLPLALVLSTLSVWLTEEGVSRTSIGLFAVITTPYALKFMWSPLIDQLRLPLFTSVFGRRRGWMIFTQICLIISFVALGATDPSVNVVATAFCALFLAVASASQDIVIDAYRVEVLQEHQQGAGAAMIVFGYRIGMLISGAGALFLAQYYGWFVAYSTMAVVVSVGVVTVMITGEPDIKSVEQVEELENTLVKMRLWLKRAVVEPFVDFMSRPGWLVILMFIVLYKFGDAFAGVMTNPFLIELGFSKVEIATVVKTFGLVAVLLGAFLGGVMVNKIGMMKSLWVCGILQMVSNLAFVMQSYVGYDLQILALTIGIENLSGGMGTTAFVAYISGLCNLQYTATQYALFSSLAATGRTWLSASSGWFVDMLDWPGFFILSTVIAVPGLLLLVRMRKI